MLPLKTNSLRKLAVKQVLEVKQVLQTLQVKETLKTDSGNLLRIQGPPLTKLKR